MSLCDWSSAVCSSDQFVSTVTHHTMVHEQISRFFTGFRRDAHPMATMVGVGGALSAFYHDALDINNQIGRASGRGREKISVVAVSLKKKVKKAVMSQS